MGASIDYSDPFFPILPKNRIFNKNLTSIDIKKDNIKKYDCVVIITDHDNYDYELIYNHSKLIIDTRGKFRIGKNTRRA